MWRCCSNRRSPTGAVIADRTATCADEDHHLHFARGNVFDETNSDIDRRKGIDPYDLGKLVHVRQNQRPGLSGAKVAALLIRRSIEMPLSFFARPFTVLHWRHQVGGNRRSLRVSLFSLDHPVANRSYGLFSHWLRIAERTRSQTCSRNLLLRPWTYKTLLVLSHLTKTRK